MYQSPTGGVTPVPCSVEECSTAKECILFALVEESRNRSLRIRAGSAAANKTRRPHDPQPQRVVGAFKSFPVYEVNLRERVGILFPQRGDPHLYVGDSLAQLVREGLVSNPNANLPNVRAVYQLTPLAVASVSGSTSNTLADGFPAGVKSSTPQSLDTDQADSTITSRTSKAAKKSQKSATRLMKKIRKAKRVKLAVTAKKNKNKPVKAKKSKR